MLNAIMASVLVWLIIVETLTKVVDQNALEVKNVPEISHVLETNVAIRALVLVVKMQNVTL